MVLQGGGSVLKILPQIIGGKMKKSSFFLAIATFFIFTSIAHAAGFRDLSWRDNLSDMKGMKHIGTDTGYGGGIELYVRPMDALEMGEAKIDMIVYKFWNNKLFGVSIVVTDFADYTALKYATQEKYGEGLKYNPFTENYIWFGPPTRMHLEYNETAGKGRLALYSSDLVKEAESFTEKKGGATLGF